MSDPMQDIRASFFVECEELLEALFDALQDLSAGGAGTDTINVAFRAVHSIKGGAGAFALNDLVAFAHDFETVMDCVRAGQLTPDDTLTALFFRCGDVLSDLVRQSRDGDPIDPAAYAEVTEALRAASGDHGQSAEVDAADFEVATLDLDDLMSDGGDLPLPELDLPPLSDILGGDAPPPGPSHYRIAFHPDSELYAAGNEPLFLLRALAELGRVHVSANLSPPASFDDAATGNALDWTIELETDLGLAEVREVFEFVEGLCRLDISPTAPWDPDPPAEPVPPDPPLPPAGADILPLAPPPRDAPPADPPLPAAKAVTAAATVRVDLDRVDRLVNLVGELVINQAMLSQSVEEAAFSSSAGISKGLEDFLQLTRDLQESVMMIRAQPVKSLFQRMSRIVREASSAVGKKARLVTEGEATEIDKTVIERLADPLTHMIRNAVDHGLESGDRRRAAGKPEEGTVRLTASHRSGRVVIEISDDGGGIDRARVRRIAVDKGLVPADAQLSDTEVDHLLFLPGFSTAETVSNLSGRGVGMDVVKSAITALGGRIGITTEAGAGTTFSISLPLTLAVLDGMVIGIGAETLVIPLSSISETQNLRRDDIQRLGPRTSVVSVRNSFIPLLDLGVELGYRDPLPDYHGHIVLIVAQEDGSRAALVVDRIEDQRQVVIKGLQDTYGRVPGVAAATILGNGRIALILDTADLVNNATGYSRPIPDLKEAI